MKNKFIEILERHTPKNVYLQGTLNPAKSYPKEFTTYWTNYTDDNGHLDDEVVSVDWSFTAIFYSSDAVRVNTKPREILADLKAAGFIPQGLGHDAPSDEQTHTGWAMDFIYTENL